MEGLKNCAHCDGEAEHYYCTPDGKHISPIKNYKLWGQKTSHNIIRCKKCGIQTKVYATEKGCFNAWNRRV